MKKLLLSTALVALAATPAMAQESPLNIDIGGYFNGYVATVDQDEAAGREINDFDILRNTELHLTGETTLDNGLTVGLHFETEADGSDSLEVEESYMYLSGAWGRLNFGAEDGAAYLLQVAAPAADANIDGIRQIIQPVNYAVALNDSAGANLAIINAELANVGLLGLTNDGFNAALAELRWDYDQNPTGYADKLTYLTPVLNGFQAAVSYTPDVGTNNGDANSVTGLREEGDSFTSWSDLDGDGVIDAGETGTAGSLADGYEGAVRYEGQWNELGFAVGAGYSHVNYDDTANLNLDDWKIWNVGVDMDYGPFGLGVVYLEDDNQDAPGVSETETIVVGVDYTTGPFKLGASFFNQETEVGTLDVETDRYTGGVVYTYGPGMTFRGSVSYIDHDLESVGDIDATSVLVGTQVLF